MPSEKGPAYLPELENRIARIKVTSVGRFIKMLRPICATCQRGQFPWDWWKRCKHNPYITIAEDRRSAPKYETGEDGRTRVTGTETFVEFREQLNWVPVSLNKRISSGSTVQRKRRISGFIFPEELRTPTYPNGVAPPCEFRNCFRQKDVKEYRWGRFCRRIEAQLIGHDIRMDGGGGALEVGQDSKSQEKQRRQLEEVPL
jgi:hypothetical protein